MRSAQVNLTMSDDFTPKTAAEIHTSAIQRSLAVLDDALKRCHAEDLRHSAVAEAALAFLERHATEKWPFVQFRKALEGFSTEPVKAARRWQALHASLTAIRRVSTTRLKISRGNPVGEARKSCSDQNPRLPCRYIA